ncbi:diaminopimelate decarboxylase [Virgibacillus necropolis]|uniref:Diaminopimelate decarboxylase n=1 Tax=Virgibacillus necropolis TaxID=163877 RepID=A0A221MCT3_9BACI|nr:diaminopimelate decarboxylase [Virgibacillus necropolis]ASN05465.1 diaminopimelate decarboxylase [Virgibacillus necropolis]
MIIENHPFQINSKGHLEIGGMDATLLAEKHGTPLYVYDVSIIRENCKSFLQSFKDLDVQAQVAYASKAFSSVAMLQVIKQENLSLDVVSQGELHTALKAGFPTERIHVHGNNKSYDELLLAVENNVGCIVVDNFHEINLIETILQNNNYEINVLIRVTPGVESNTHQYIMTGNEDSKFGFSLQNGQAEEAFLQMHKHNQIHVKGLHCHIGSQIFETDRFMKTIDLLFETITNWKESYQYIPDVLNVGGGFGIRYTNEDNPLEARDYVQAITNAISGHASRLGIPMPEIWIEPGRSIVGNAGITLYTIGSMKHIPEIRTYISVDGGMTDNLRPALYQAKYEGVIANKANEEIITEGSIAGKCCESGDMLIWDLPIPEVEPGDTLAVFSTGAYGYSMANHYNRFPNPAVVFVENGVDKLVVKRETYQDLSKNDLSYE